MSLRLEQYFYALDPPGTQVVSSGIAPQQCTALEQRAANYERRHNRVQISAFPLDPDAPLSSQWALLTQRPAPGARSNFIAHAYVVPAGDARRYGVNWPWLMAWLPWLPSTKVPGTFEPLELELEPELDLLSLGFALEEMGSHAIEHALAGALRALTSSADDRVIYLPDSKARETTATALARWLPSLIDQHGGELDPSRLRLLRLAAIMAGLPRCLREVASFSTRDDDALARLLLHTEGPAPRAEQLADGYAVGIVSWAQTHDSQGFELVRDVRSWMNDAVSDGPGASHETFQAAYRFYRAGVVPVSRQQTSDAAVLCDAIGQLERWRALRPDRISDTLAVASQQLESSDKVRVWTCFSKLIKRDPRIALEGFEQALDELMLSPDPSARTQARTLFESLPVSYQENLWQRSRERGRQPGLVEEAPDAPVWPSRLTTPGVSVEEFVKRHLAAQALSGRKQGESAAADIIVGFLVPQNQVPADVARRVISDAIGEAGFSDNHLMASRRLRDLLRRADEYPGQGLEQAKALALVLQQMAAALRSEGWRIILRVPSASARARTLEALRILASSSAADIPIDLVRLQFEWLQLSDLARLPRHLPNCREFSAQIARDAGSMWLNEFRSFVSSEVAELARTGDSLAAFTFGAAYLQHAPESRLLLDATMQAARPEQWTTQQIEASVDLLTEALAECIHAAQVQDDQPQVGSLLQRFVEHASLLQHAASRLDEVDRPMPRELQKMIPGMRLIRRFFGGGRT